MAPQRGWGAQGETDLQEKLGAGGGGCVLGAVLGLAGPSWPPQATSLPVHGRPSGRGLAQANCRAPGWTQAKLPGSGPRSGRGAGRHGLWGWAQGQGQAYVTEHCTKARYSSSTSRPRFSSLRNSCTHLQGTGLPECRPGRRSCPVLAQNGHSKGPWAALSQEDNSLARPSDARR